MIKGIVKSFDQSRGFGYILKEGTNEEIFVYKGDLDGEGLQENDEVQFDIIEGRVGVKAINVRRSIIS